MPKNKRLPEELLSRLHGRGTMSEILDIERTRLLKQSEEDMRRRLGGPSQAAPADAGSQTSPLPSAQISYPAEAAAKTPPAPDAAQHSVLVAAPAPAAVSVYSPDAQQTAPTQPVAANQLSEKLPAAYSGPTAAPAPQSDFVQAPQVPSPRPSATPVRGVEGLSTLSRVVGDDFSEFGAIFRHSDETVASTPRFAPEPGRSYYSEIVEPSLPFTAQRNLLAAIRRLTLGWGVLSCQITLELLANASGIRNFKTLRKWLADLHHKNLIRYTPVHGDLRGSVVTLSPPPEVRHEIERGWRDGMIQTRRSSHV